MCPLEAPPHLGHLSAEDFGHPVQTNFGNRHSPHGMQHEYEISPSGDYLIGRLAEPA
jgi:hypothetical protein